MDSGYAIRVTDGLVEAWSTVRLPFEPKGWLLDFRNELRLALLETRPLDGGRLHAVYGADDVGQFVDVENVLLYNVGAASLGHLADRGVTFERAFHIPQPPAKSGLQAQGLHYHRYATTVAEGFQHWRMGEPLASFKNVGVASFAKPGPIWAAIRQHGTPPVVTHRVPTRFVAELTIRDTCAACVRANPASQIKPALDAIIAAFHTHVGDSDACSERLAQTGLGEKTDLQGMLADPRWGALGPRTLIRRFGAHSVQWNPADDLCMAATIKADTGDASPNGPRWQLTGRLWSAIPVNAQ